MTRTKVYELIDGERDYQDERWGADRRAHSPEEWLTYIQDYAAEAQHIMSRETDATAKPKAMEIIRKITAMGVAAMEEHETNARQ